MKNVLVVTYSQSGQLSDIVRSLIAPLQAAGVAVHVEILKPVTPFPFPWGPVDFLDVFPESVRLDPPPLEPLSVPPETEFDLVMLTYQVWYLAPALPMTAFLQSPAARSLLAGKAVVTLVACRNMWITAQATMRRLIDAAGGRLCDHIALVDPGHPLATFITTPRWVLTGRRDRFLGLPPAGVTPAEIDGVSRFGRALADSLLSGTCRPGQPMLSGLRAVVANPRLAISERAGARAFRVWSGIIRAFGRRGQKRRWPILAVFAVYLIIMIITVVPLSLLVQSLLRPFLQSRLDRLKATLEEPSGSQADRLPNHVS